MDFVPSVVLRRCCRPPHFHTFAAPTSCSDPTSNVTRKPKPGTDFRLPVSRPFGRSWLFWRVSHYYFARPAIGVPLFCAGTTKPGAGNLVRPDASALFVG